MQALTDQLTAGLELTPEQIEQAVAQLTDAAIPDVAKAGFLRALRNKGETAAEIAAFVQALLARAVDPLIDPARMSGPMLDICGTGGDRLELFNISTASMFVLAAGGAAVVKHGNRAITSQCGGADVLEELGVRIDLPPPELKRCVEALGLGFIFAPAYHPAFKTIAPVRKLLASEGTATVFNLLGPLLNPARPAFQLVGIFDPRMVPKYAAVLTLLGRTTAWAVSTGGADEILPSGRSVGMEARSGNPLRPFHIEPDELGIDRCTHDDLRGGDRVENARILVGILNGSDQGPKRTTVLLNAAAGFVVSGLAPDLAAGLQHAREQIDNGGALAKLEGLRSFTT
jgi:anthranilate phosphoribosyltransferase